MKTIMLVEVYKTVNYAGGIERVLCNFANEFVSRGYKVKYVCLDLEKGMPYYPLSEKVDFINLCYLGEAYCGFKYYSSKILKEIFRSLGGRRCPLAATNYMIQRKHILKMNLLKD